MSQTAISSPDIPVAAALGYAALGWKVFPLGHRSKIPLTENGYHDATTDEKQIRKWWGARSKSGIGVACQPSGLVVIDIDPGHGGQESFDALLRVLGPLPPTITASTGGGGTHYVFRCPPTLTRARGHLGKGIDVKLHGYIVVSPSIHPSGNRYRWQSGLGEVELADLPQGWLDAIVPPVVERRETSAPAFTGQSTKYGLSALEGECTAVKSAPEGGRNNRLNQAAFSAGQLEAGGELDPSDVMPALLDAATACGLPDREAKRTIESGLRSGRLSPRRAPERPHHRAPELVAPPTDEDTPPWEPSETESPPDADGVVADTTWQESLSFKVKEDGSRVLIKTPGNLALLLAHSLGWQGCLCYDELDHSAGWAHTPPELPGLARPRGRLTDEHLLYIRQWMLLHHGIDWNKDAVWEAVQLASVTNKVHPVQRYLSTLVWDGQRRIHNWLETYLGGVAPAQVGRWWLISAIARAMCPSCQADHALILEGPQGRGKSSALRVLAGEWYQGHLGDLRDKDGVQSLLGAWIVEIAELDALRGQAISKVKEFLSQTQDRYRPSYGRAQVVRPRTCVFAGTTNDATYLHDPTGARRFWPVTVTRLDVDRLEADRDQIWAEALTEFRAGASWWPTKDEDLVELEAATEARQAVDPWETAVAEGAHRQIGWTTTEILLNILHVDVERQDRQQAMRVGAVMKRLGYSRRLEQRGGLREYRYYRPM